MAETANAGVQMAKRRPQTAIAGARPTLFPANREERRSANNSDRDGPNADGDRYAELEQHQPDYAGCILQLGSLQSLKIHSGLPISAAFCSAGANL